MADADVDAVAVQLRDLGWSEKIAFDYDKYQESDNSGFDYHGVAPKIYEWKDEYGDVGPRFEELEKILFGGEHILRQGDHLENLTGFEVTVESSERLSPIQKASLSPDNYSNQS